MCTLKVGMCSLNQKYNLLLISTNKLVINIFTV